MYFYLICRSYCVWLIDWWMDGWIDLIWFDLIRFDLIWFDLCWCVLMCVDMCWCVCVCCCVLICVDVCVVVCVDVCWCVLMCVDLIWFDLIWFELIWLIDWLIDTLSIYLSMVDNPLNVNYPFLKTHSLTLRAWYLRCQPFDVGCDFVNISLAMERHYGHGLISNFWGSYYMCMLLCTYIRRSLYP